MDLYHTTEPLASRGTVFDGKRKGRKITSLRLGLKKQQPKTTLIPNLFFKKKTQFNNNIIFFLFIIISAFVSF